MNIGINIPVLLIAGSVLALIVLAIVVFTRERRLGDSPTEMRLKSLFVMSEDTSTKQSVVIADWREAALRSIKLTEEAKSYCSHTILKDFTAENLEPRDYISIQWRLDFVHPDRYHVTQEACQAELGEIWLDEWVTIGGDHYENAGLWDRTDDGRRDGVNTGLRVDDMLDIVRYAAPISSEVHQYEGQRYLLLHYDAPASGDVCRGFLEGCEEPKYPKQIQIWINLESGFLAKGTILFKEKTPDGETPIGEMQRMFTCYNEDVKVYPPPWLNLVPDSEGQRRVVNTKVPILRHHP
jgi:hypothetical protein